MKKTFKVVMLPTEKTSNTNIWLNKNNKKPRIENYSPRLESFGWINQHLYIISDDEIKEGDWMYNTHHNIISKGPGGGNHYDKKIVATTDKSLNECNVCGMSNGYHKISCKTTSIITKLPQLPESFIQAFIKAYNEGKPITEVDLEMEYNKLYPMVENNNLIIKTRPDNVLQIGEEAETRT